MANANIPEIQITNTFDQWRTETNNLIKDRNQLRNTAYVKDEKDFTIANGSLFITNTTRGNASIARDLTVGNTIFTGNIVEIGRAHV